MKTLFVTTLSLKDNVDYFDSIIKQAGFEKVAFNACKHIDDNFKFDTTDYLDYEFVFFDGNFLDVHTLCAHEIFIILKPKNIDIDIDYCNKFKISKEDIMNVSRSIFTTRVSEHLAYFEYSNDADLVKFLKKIHIDGDLNFMTNMTDGLIETIENAQLGQYLNDQGGLPMVQKILQDKFKDDNIILNSST